MITGSLPYLIAIAGLLMLGFGVMILLMWSFQR